MPLHTWELWLSDEKEIIKWEVMMRLSYSQTLKHLCPCQQVESQDLKTNLTAKTPPCSNISSHVLSHLFRLRGSSYGWRWLRRPWPNSMAPTLPCRQGVPSRAWPRWRGLPVTRSCSRSAPPTPGRNLLTQTSSGPRCWAPRRPGERKKKYHRLQKSSFLSTLILHCVLWMYSQ